MVKPLCAMVQPVVILKWHKLINIILTRIYITNAKFYMFLQIDKIRKSENPNSDILK